MTVHKILSWNVNGLRSVLTKGFEDWVRTERPDILALQEVRATAEQVALELADYHFAWNPAQKKGYSGTAVFSRIKPLSHQIGMGIPEHDNEGRVLTVEYPDYYLANVYTPNAQPELARLSYRQEWDRVFFDFLQKLEVRKPVIVGGDFNVAHQEIDLARPKANRRNAGFTDEERDGFQRYLNHGLLDSFRCFEPGPGHYTWWSQRSNCRQKNIGWRIDYILVSQSLGPRLRRAWILKDVMGSDHAPVGLEIIVNR
jgi:exodeoxyribonuclease-3